MEAKEIERADENGAKEDVRVDVKMDEEWVHSADEDLYKEDTQELKQFISGTTSRLGDCAKITMLGWSYGLVLMLNLVANITLFILAIIYYSKDLPEPDSLMALNALMTCLLIIEVAIQAVITRHGPCNRWKVFEYSLALMCLTALFTYLIDTDALDEVFGTAVLAFRSVAVLIRVALGITKVGTYREQAMAAEYARVDFDIIEDIQADDDDEDYE
ncbi:hypothetical protein AAMO2058_001101200 [Amorphochlora amoebiformis]